jgi:fumarate reductase flavoprotein subunit
LKRENLESQLVVLGSGGTGLAAALTAAEAGVDVLLIEKGAHGGGNTAMARGIFAADSPVQKRMNIEAPKDELFRLAMSYAHWATDPRLVRAFIDKSGDTIQWLEEKGLQFEGIPNYNNVGRLVFHVPAGRGAELVRLLVRKCKESGVRLLTRTATTRLVTGEGGKIAGIVATSNDGTEDKELVVAAGAVVIATGGYAGNRELLKKYYEYYTDDLCLHGVPNMGDGLRLSTEIGAATEGLGVLHLRGPRYGASTYITTVVEEPNTLWVNKRGERFVDEAMAFYWPEAGNALSRQPDSASYTLFDGGIMRGFVDEGLIKGVAHYPPGTKMTELDRRLRSQPEKYVKISTTWGEIASWMGVSPDVLQSTIDEYNRFCDRGHDETFAKDARFLAPLRTPPYYAIKCSQSFHGTIGGIRINHHMEGLNQQSEPIPGLYAGGIDVGGWESRTYGITLPGSAFGFALNSGRIAGENAVAYLKRGTTSSRGQA